MVSPSNVLNLLDAGVKKEQHSGSFLHTISTSVYWKLVCDNLCNKFTMVFLVFFVDEINLLKLYERCD